MRYKGDFMMNFDGAVKSKDSYLQEDMLLDQIAVLIDQSPSAVETALRNSSISVSKNASKIELIDSVVKGLSSNETFRLEISKLIAGPTYSNTIGDKDSKAPEGATAKKGVSIGADPLTAIAGAVGSIFGFAASVQEKKAKEAEAKSRLYEKIFGDDKKKNIIPIVVISLVLIIGGVIAFAALRSPAQSGK